jgi:hypothetical protein
MIIAAALVCGVGIDSAGKSAADATAVPGWTFNTPPELIKGHDRMTNCAVPNIRRRRQVYFPFGRQEFLPSVRLPLRGT